MSGHTRSSVALFVLFFLFAAAPSVPQVPQLGETMEVSIINVDVFVTDRDGRRVRGLGPDDFEVLENGVPQKLSNFAEYSDGQGDAIVGLEGAPQTEAPPRQQRTVVIFLEAMHMPEFRSRPYVDALKKTLREIVGAGDSVSVVIWNRTVARHLQFTDDVSAAEKALDVYAELTRRAQVDAGDQQLREMQSIAEFERNLDAMSAAAGMSTFRPPGIEDSTNVYGTSAPNVAGLQMQIALMEMKRRVAAIKSVIDTMAGAEGKKLLLLGTKRLGEVAGAEFAYAAGTTMMPHELRIRFGTTELIQSLIDEANASGVTIYPLYVPGLVTRFAEAGVSPGLALDNAAAGIASPGVENLTLLNETVSLTRIAEKTGGLTAWSATDVVKLLPQVASDVSDYYSLAYRINSSNADLARDIVVRTKNRDLRVRSRRQFVEKSYETRMKDRLNATLFHTAQTAPMPISAAVGPAKKHRKGAALPVTIRIPISALTMLPQDGKRAGSFSVFVASAADLDELSEITQRTQPFEIAEADVARAMVSHFTYDLDLVVNDKVRYVAVGVLDEVSKEYGLQRIELEPR